MSSLLYNSISRIARHEANARFIAGVGVVTELFNTCGSNNEYAVSVKMRDSGLVLPRVPIAVDILGFASLPVVDDLVIILFLNGDVNSGVVVGRIYHANLNPPKHEEGEVVLKLPPGKEEPDVALEMKIKEPLVKLTLPDDVAVTCSKDAIAMNVGDIKIQLTAAGGGRAEIASGGSTITLKKDGDITISSKGKLNLDAQEVSISGQTKVTINGVKVDIN